MPSAAASTAFTATGAYAEWAASPRTWQRKLRFPLCAITGDIRVGSPTTPPQGGTLAPARNAPLPLVPDPRRHQGRLAHDAARGLYVRAGGVADQAAHADAADLLVI